MITVKLFKSMSSNTFDMVTIKDIHVDDVDFIENVKIGLKVFYDKFVQNSLVMEFSYVDDTGVVKTLTSYSRGRTMEKTISDAIGYLKTKELMYYIK